MITYFENIIVRIYIILNFVLIKFYLPFDPLNYFLYIILDYKYLKFKHLIDDILINLWHFENFVSMEDNKKMLFTGIFVKIHIQ